MSLLVGLRVSSRSPPTALRSRICPSTWRREPLFAKENPIGRIIMQFQEAPLFNRSFLQHGRSMDIPAMRPRVHLRLRMRPHRCLGGNRSDFSVFRHLAAGHQYGHVDRHVPKPDEPDQKGDAAPVRATLDDPPIHIRPTVPAISGCKAKEPFRFRPLRHMQGGTAAFQSQRIFCRKRQESGDKRLKP